MNRLNGKVAIITGCNSGIAYAVAEKFLEEGAKVVGLDVNVEAANAFAKNHADSYVVLKGSVTDKNDWEAACVKAKECFGKLTTIVNIAGINGPMELEDVTEESWLRTMKVNQFGSFLGMQMGSKYFEDHAGCSIINTASVAGMHGEPYSSSNDISYNASKAGLRYMSKYAAWHLGSRGIRVNNIIPGGVNTPIHKDYFASLTKEQFDGMMDSVKERVCLPPYMAEPEDLAYSYVFLASDEAKFITGIDLVVDGGWTAK